MLFRKVLAATGKAKTFEAVPLNGHDMVLLVL